MESEKAYDQIEDVKNLFRIANRLLIEVAREHKENSNLRESCICLNQSAMHLDLAQDVFSTD